MNQCRCETCKNRKMKNPGHFIRDHAFCKVSELYLYGLEQEFINKVGCASHSEFRADCIWTEDDDGIYLTSCENAFEFMNGSPEDNHMKFCPYCGKLLRQKGGKKFRDTTNDDENVDYRGYF